MPVLSIVACKMLEDELVHLLSVDREVRELLLVDGRECLTWIAALMPPTFFLRTQIQLKSFVF